MTRLRSSRSFANQDFGLIAKNIRSADTAAMASRTRGSTSGRCSSSTDCTK